VDADDPNSGFLRITNTAVELAGKATPPRSQAAENPQQPCTPAPVNGIVLDDDDTQNSSIYSGGVQWQAKQFNLGYTHGAKPTLKINGVFNVPGVNSTSVYEDGHYLITEETQGKGNHSFRRRRNERGLRVLYPRQGLAVPYSRLQVDQRVRQCRGRSPASGRVDRP
jgi:hypothetical protein